MEKKNEYKKPKHITTTTTPIYKLNKLHTHTKCIDITWFIRRRRRRIRREKKHLQKVVVE